MPNGCIISRRPTRPDEFARPCGKLAAGREEQQARRADAVGGHNRDVGGLKMFAAVAVDVDRAGHQPAAFDFQPADARAGDELDAER